MPNASTVRTPSYRKHKATGQAVVTLNGRDTYLGRYGTRESKAEYDRIITEWLANGRRLPATDSLTVAELIERFWPWVEQHYRKPDGNQTSEVGWFRHSLRPLRHLYGTTTAKDFGPLAFKAVRQLMVNGYTHPKYGVQAPPCRGVINHRMERIRQMFRWATENELVPASVYHGLLAVRGLQRGRSEARETEPIRPVPEAHINAVRPFVSRPVEALIDLQLLTGARPGELCIMRAADLNMTGRIWTYCPQFHKTEHHGHRREIYLGPRAQEIVQPFLKSDLKAYLFSPKDAEAERLRVLRQNRKSKVQPSQVCRRRKNPTKTLGDRYTVASYRQAIARACAKAFPLPAHLAPRVNTDGRPETPKEWRACLTPEEKTAVRQWHRQHAWHPHQLRHSAGTNLRREYGVELARIILGHKHVRVTELYAEVDRAQAIEVIGRVG
jgi:integrase